MLSLIFLFSLHSKSNLSWDSCHVASIAKIKHGTRRRVVLCNIKFRYLTRFGGNLQLTAHMSFWHIFPSIFFIFPLLFFTLSSFTCFLFHDISCRYFNFYIKSLLFCRYRVDHSGIFSQEAMVLVLPFPYCIDAIACIC